MNAEHILSYAKDRGIELSITPDLRLEARASRIILTPETIRYLKDSRAVLVDKLCDYQFQEEVMRIIFPDDIAFVVKQVRYLCGRDRLRTVRRYLEEFDTAFDAEANLAKKRNAGRRRANTWLRQERGKDKIGQLTATVESLQKASERSENEPGSVS